MKQGDLRVWWIPQVPMRAFRVCVDSVKEGVLLIDTLGKYDIFQLENRIKPDFCNAGGLEMYDHGEWSDWYFEGDTGYWDDPKEFLKDNPSGAAS